MPVYFIQAGADGPIKIGVARKPMDRVSQLQTAHYQELSLRRVIAGSHSAEEWLHQRFAARHIAREWFVYHPDMDTVEIPDEWLGTTTARYMDIILHAKDSNNFSITARHFNISRERVRQIASIYETETGDKLMRGARIWASGNSSSI